MEIKPFEKKIWLSTPTMHGEEIQFVQKAFDTNWVSTVGENINELEAGIAREIGCKYAVALASGTSAIHLAVKLAGVKQGDKVFCTDTTFAATVNPGSKRKTKKASGIYLMEHIQGAGVLIECGFLSNYQEEAKLRTPEYQKQLCCVIISALSQFLGS